MACIEAHNVNYCYRMHGVGLESSTRTALSDVCFKLTQGDRLALIGPNGGGKSTLLKCLSGMLKVSAGRLTVDGDALSILDRHAHFIPRASLIENAQLVGASFGFRGVQIKEFADKSIKEAGLWDRCNEPLASLSAGMAGRFNLVLNTQVVKPIMILDEWISTLDIHSINDGGMLNRLSTEAEIVVLASHNRAFTEKLCNKFLFLESGSVKYFGEDSNAAYNILEDKTTDAKIPVIEKPSPIKQKACLPKGKINFISIPKSGNFGVKRLLGEQVYPSFEIVFCPQGTKLKDIPIGEKVVFFYRNPIERYAIAFDSRKRKGAPFYESEWSDQERQIFSEFNSADDLAVALSSEDIGIRNRAFYAISKIRNVRVHLKEWLGGVADIENRAQNIFFAGDAGDLVRNCKDLQEMLGGPSFDDVGLLKKIDQNRIKTIGQLSAKGRENILKWYVDDFSLYQLLETL